MRALVLRVKKAEAKVVSGVFGAQMDIALDSNGPVNIQIDID